MRLTIALALMLVIGTAMANGSNSIQLDSQAELPQGLVDECVKAAMSVRATALDLGKPEITVEDVIRAQVLSALRQERKFYQHLKEPTK